MPFRRAIFLVVAIGLSFATTVVVRDWVVATRLAAAPFGQPPAPAMPEPPVVPAPAAASVAAPAPVVAAAHPPAQVLVAARALPSGHLLTDDDVRWQAWPDDDLARTYIVKAETGDIDIGKGDKGLDALSGAVVREAIAAGEPITGERLVRRGERGFLAAFLTPGRRAITIAIAANPLLNGLAGPGDRVDLICTAPPPGATGGQRKPKPSVSEILLHDVKLLALDQRIDDQPGDFPMPRTATLEVTPKQAEMIALAADRGKFSLALRSNTTPEASDDETGPLAWDDPPPPLAPPLRTEPVTGSKVSIIRGGSVSELDFVHPAK
jgi:pilus assembly protein CpaB